MAHAKSSDPAIPPKFGTCTRTEFKGPPNKMSGTATALEKVSAMGIGHITGDNDISTSYTSIPHKLLKSRIAALLHN